VRVTGAMQNIQLLKNLRYNNSTIMELQDKLATGQKIQRPDDDPVGIGYLMRYNTELSRSDQFLENARTGIGWLNTMDAAMQQANDVLKRAKQLTQQGSTGTVPEEARKQIASEIRQLYEQMVSIGNSTYDGRYIFNGQKTDTAPYTNATAANDKTDPGSYYLNVSPFVTVPVSITGEIIFGKAGDTENVFNVLNDIANHLDSNDQSALLQDLSRIDACSDRISVSWAEVGARTNRFELVVNRLTDEQGNLKNLRSQVNDVDMAQAITDLQLRQNVLQASLATGAQIMRVSLVDFLK